MNPESPFYKVCFVAIDTLGGGKAVSRLDS